MRFTLLIFLVFTINNTILSNVIIKNNGQIENDEVKYLTEFGNWKVFFLKDRISFVISEVEMVQEDRNKDVQKNLRWDLVLEKLNFEIIEEKKAIQSFNFIQSNNFFLAPSFNQITYKNKSYDIVFYNHPEKGLKYDIVYHQPKYFGSKTIQFNLVGISGIKKLEETILIETLLGNFNFIIPFAYADKNWNGKISREKINILTEVKNHQILINFNFENAFQSVIIDPWTSYCGGTDIEENYGSAFDYLGNSYISGYTSSIDFPTTSGVIQTNFNGIYDSYVFKFDSTGQRIWATYYGGTNNDFGSRIVVDSSNKPILTGYTYSSDLLVSPSGVFNSNFSGIFDAFLTRLNTDGTFDWGTFYGGTGGEFVADIDIKNNEIIIGGYTSSLDLPVIGSAWQTTQNGALDIFLAKFDTTGNRIWDTYYGGTNSEDAHSISFDESGNIIIGGDTYSSDFPISIGAYQNFYNAGSEMYLVKFNSNGQRMWSTYLGGMNNEDCRGIDCDKNDNIYFTGYSTGNDLPITSGAFQSNLSGDRDFIIGSFSPGGNLRWLTYAGGTDWDMAYDINVNSGGIVTLTGESFSTNYPEVGNVFQIGNAGSSDVVYMISDSLGFFSLSTLFGGVSADVGRSLTFDHLSKMIVSGNTFSSNFPVSSGVFQNTYSGQGDAFAKVIDSISGVFVNINERLIIEENYLFPNPSNGEIIIPNLNIDDYMINIYSLDGKKVLTKKFENTNEIRLSSEFKNLIGTYFIELIGNEKIYIYKIIRY